ncbi:MAG: hypothetical protein AAF456_22980, partial [Planctomycetota bacterium]
MAEKRSGYCLNIHPGTTLEAVKRNLSQHSLDVKQRVCPASPLGVGLWLSDTVSKELVEGDAAAEFG